MILNKKILLLFFICSISTHFVFAQGEFATSREPDNYNLNSFGIKLNSNGLGGYYSFSQRVTYRLRRFYEAEYNFLKDPKEIKIENSFSPLISSRSFVYGKINSVHNLKVGYGYNRMIFEKRDKNSVSIHLLGSLGISLCVSKPIYYEYIVYFNNQEYETTTQKFDRDELANNSAIIGKGPVKLGFNELTLQPGFYAKFGLSFDFSQDVMRTNTLEAGIAVDGFIKPVEILAGHRKSMIFTLYVMYKFGQKYDAKLNKEFRREQRKLERRNN